MASGHTSVGADGERGRLGSVIQRLELLPAGVHLAITLGMLAAIAIVDAVAPKDLSLTVFYFLPVFWATWFAGRRESFFMAVLASVVWGAADMAGGQTTRVLSIALWNEVMRLVLFLGVWAIMSEVRSISETRKHLALTDPLTGVANMRVLSVDIEREIERARRYGHPFALVYLDLDKFKSVNDTLGHQAGDEVLRGVADYLVRHARDLDTVARFGGDEFGVLMPETDEQAAILAVERMAEGLNAAVRQTAPTVSGLGVTLGVCVFLGAPWSVDHAIMLADELMYEGKRKERGTVTFSVFRPE